ncbi:hypothetical protein FRC01_001947 [Tulasnella sp. 417]|nr:hypothetical protein FRC01_001947 [Tulasnella sp. 417]
MLVQHSLWKYGASHLDHIEKLFYTPPAQGQYKLLKTWKRGYDRWGRHAFQRRKVPQYGIAEYDSITLFNLEAWFLSEKLPSPVDTHWAEHRHANDEEKFLLLVVTTPLKLFRVKA